MLAVFFSLFSFYTQYKYQGDILTLFQTPVNASLGGDHVVLPDTNSYTFQNPSFAPSYRQIGISHYIYHDGFLNIESLYFAGLSEGHYTLSIFAGYIHSQPVELTSLIDTSEGAVNGNIKIQEEKAYKSVYMKTQASRKVSANTSAGLSIAFLLENLPDYNIQGLSIDAGVTYIPSPIITTGFLIKNLLSTKIENGQKEILRPAFLASVSTGFEKLKYVFTLVAEDDGAKNYALFTVNSMSVYAAVGVEYQISKKIKFRAGTGRRGITMGAGLLFNRIGVDYGIVPSGEIGMTHKLRLYYSFE